MMAKNGPNICWQSRTHKTWSTKCGGGGHISKRHKTDLSLLRPSHFWWKKCFWRESKINLKERRCSWIGLGIRQHGYGYYKCYYCGNNSTGPDRYEITFMKYHPLCITRWIFPYLQGNLFHIFNRCHKIIWILFQLILRVLGKCSKNAQAPAVPPKPIIIFLYQF